MKTLKKAQLSCAKNLVLSSAVLVAMALTACNKKQVEGGTTASGNGESRNVNPMEGAYIPYTPSMDIPSDIVHFKPNPAGYHSANQVQLTNYDFTDWRDNNITTNPNLKNHPYAFSSPRFANSSSSNIPYAGPYKLNTAYFMADATGKLVRKGAGQFGTSVILQSSVTLFGLATIPGQISNVALYADKNDAYNGFVATDINTANGWPTATPFQARPDNMVVYFKYRPNGTDKAVCEVMLHSANNVGTANAATRLPAMYPGSASTMSKYKTVDENVVGYTRARMNGTLNDGWYRMSVPIYYKDDTTVPDYAIFICASSNGYSIVTNSELELDRVVFEYKN